MLCYQVICRPCPVEESLDDAGQNSMIQVKLPTEAQEYSFFSTFEWIDTLYRILDEAGRELEDRRSIVADCFRQIITQTKDILDVLEAMEGQLTCHFTCIAPELKEKSQRQQQEEVHSGQHEQAVLQAKQSAARQRAAELTQRRNDHQISLVQKAGGASGLAAAEAAELAALLVHKTVFKHRSTNNMELWEIYISCAPESVSISYYKEGPSTLYTFVHYFGMWRTIKRNDMIVFLLCHSSNEKVWQSADGSRNSVMLTTSSMRLIFITYIPGRDSRWWDDETTDRINVVLWTSKISYTI